MLGTLGKTLTAPRIWLIATAVCFCVWIGLGYHQDQVEAQLALEIKTGEALERQVTGTDVSGIRQFSLSLAGFFILLAAYFHLRNQRLRQHAPAAPLSETALVDEAPTVFQPIIRQEEIVGRPALDDVGGGHEDVRSLKISHFVQSAVQSLRPIRNRQ